MMDAECVPFGGLLFDLQEEHCGLFVFSRDVSPSSHFSYDFREWIQEKQRKCRARNANNDDGNADIVRQHVGLLWCPRAQFTQLTP
jgi:hypothetical protein